MTADRDSRLAPSDQPDDEFDDDDEDTGRSILSATWFRVVLVLVGVVIVGAVAVPYVLEVVNPPAPPVAVASNPNLRPISPTAPAAPRTATSPTPPEGAGARPSTTAQTTAPAAAPVTSAPAPSSVSAPPPTTTAPAKPREVNAAATPATKPAPTEASKPSMPAKDEAASKLAQAAPRTERAAPARAPVAEGGEYFVQVGAFKDQETAKRVAATLRAQDYPVTESVKRVGGGAVADVPRPAPRAPAPAASAMDRSDRYDVIVTGGSTADINAKLVAKGLAAEPAGDGVRIRPSLPLRDAVALSKDLNNEGFKVQVRRGGGASSAAAAPAPVRPSAVTDGDGGGETLYRVRVGGYTDRATALSVLRALQGKGYQPFIAKGRE